MAALKNELVPAFLLCAMAVGLWLTAPAARARELSPAELIEKALPARMTIEKASKSDLLSAVCTAVRKHRRSGVGITTASATARGEYAGEIVAAVLRCAGKVDCDYVGAIVKAGASVRPGTVTPISDAAMARAPKCGEAIEGAVRAAAQSEDLRAKANSASPSEKGMEEEFDPHEKLAVVCDDGLQRAVRQSQLADFLRSHTEAVVGPCPQTPTPTPLPSLAPTPPPARP